MVDHPMVSICCLSFNHENYIYQTVSGFLMQETDFLFEILIHDDASTDNTPKILREFEKRDLRVSVIYQKENKYSKGEKPLLNYLFPKARGKYIALCEGDDYWSDPKKLQKQVEFLEKNPNFAATFHAVKGIDLKGEITEPVLDENYKKSLTGSDLKKGNYIFTSTICFRNVIKNFPPEIFEVLNGDSFLLMLLGSYGGAKFQPDILPAYYRTHQDGVWSLLSPVERSYQQKNTFEKIMQYNFRINDMMLYEYYKQRLINTHLMLLEHSIKAGKFREIGKHAYHTAKLTEENKIIILWMIFKACLNGVLKFFRFKK